MVKPSFVLLISSANVCDIFKKKAHASKYIKTSSSNSKSWSGWVRKWTARSSKVFLKWCWRYLGPKIQLITVANWHVRTSLISEYNYANTQHFRRFDSDHFSRTSMDQQPWHHHHVCSWKLNTSILNLFTVRSHFQLLNWQGSTRNFRYEKIAIEKLCNWDIFLWFLPELLVVVYICKYISSGLRNVSKN